MQVGKQLPAFTRFAFEVQGWYGFVVGAMWAGVVGVGLYSLMGTRVWCRFGCPRAALLGLVQKFGRFRVTVKEDMCISCGNCSTYCEGHRRPPVRHGQPALQARGLRRLRDVRPRLSAGLENKPTRWKAGQPIRVYAVDL